MEKTFLVIMLQCLVLGQVWSQSLLLPWHATDIGGSTSTAGQLVLQSSIGGLSNGVSNAGSLTLELGFLPGVRLLSGNSTTSQVIVEQGWNMVSVPLVVADYRKTTLFTNAISSAFTFAGTGYVTRDTLQNGAGYWVKFPTTQLINMAGTSLVVDTIGVLQGWNMVGPISYPVLSSSVVAIPPVVILGNFFGFSGGYTSEDTLQPGKSYWVKVSNAGQLVMYSGSVFRASDQAMPSAKSSGSEIVKGSDKDWKVGTVLFRTANGESGKLHLWQGTEPVDLTSKELPPMPPEGVFDLRFQSQRAIEVVNVSEKTDWEFNVLLASVTMPLTIEPSVEKIAGEVTLEVVSTEKGLVRYPLLREPVVINEESIVAAKLFISLDPKPEVPHEFVLAQNYPNPFNPTTQIKFSVALAGRATVEMFNVLGQKVKTLFNENAEPGRYYHLQFDGTNMASGVYFYRLQSGARLDTRKMVLLK
jgi:hypothetical protein